MSQPSIEECGFDIPPIPETVVCWPPGADDCFNVSGIGSTKQKAYENMLVNLMDWEDNHHTNLS